MRPLPFGDPVGMKGGEIVDQPVEPIDMAGMILRQPPRTALPAPVERADIPSLAPEMVDRIAIFLDHVGASGLEQQPATPHRTRYAWPIITPMRPAIGGDP